jgi:hypothetical protein
LVEPLQMRVNSGGSLCSQDVVSWSARLACSRRRSSRTRRRSFPERDGPCSRPPGGRPDAALAPQRERAAPDSRRIPAGATASADLACFFVAENIPHATEEEAQAIWDDHLIWPQNYDEPVSARYWYDWFDLEGGPCAKAYRLLEDVDLGPDLGSPREGPHLAFEEGAYPGDNSRWVQASGKLALSLLQARLIDLRLPLQIAEGT